MNMKTTKTWLFTVFASITATVFTACSSDEDLANTEQQERGMVRTEFAISFPQQATGLTRLSAATVQVPDNDNLTHFRGITDMKLYPFDVAASSVGATTKVPSTMVTLYGSSEIEVGKEGNSGGINTIVSADALYEKSSSHLYYNVDIPIGTKSFMFYGVAPSNSKGAEVVGDLKATTTGTTLANMKFEPKAIFEGTDVGTSGKKIAEYLTAIANTKIGDNTTWASTPNVSLRSLYLNFITIHTGAWANVKALLTQMYKNLEPLDADNEATKNMKAAIRASIANSAYGASATDDVLTFSNDYDNYPRNLKLPDGAAYVSWDNAGNKFSVVDDNSNVGINNPKLTRYATPASLYYRVLSDVVTSDTLFTKYDASKNWEYITGLYKNGSEVKAKTRSIAIEDAVQYAVARLDVTVKCGTSLLDYAGNTIPLTSGTTNTLPITAILVGGQNPVDYKFETNIATNNSDSYTVYDTQVTRDGQKYLTSTQSAPIHTLLLETKEATKANQEDCIVQIAIEVENNTGKTIVGKGGQYIYPGCRFYLIGKIDPYKENNTYLKAFQQDYTTTANLTVSSLKNAQCTLPDLTVPELQLGLSIDLTWKSGTEHNITID